MFCPRDQFLRIVNVSRGDLVQDIGGGIAQHALGADIEYLNDALLVGGDTRKVGAVENRVLQGPSFEKGVLAPDLVDALSRGSGGVENGGIANFFGHGRFLL